MTMRCQICSNPNRLEIDRQIVAGGNLNNIAQRYKVSYPALYNHKNNHISRQMLKHQEIKEVLHGKDLLETIEGLLKESQSILAKAKKKERLGVALNAIRESRSTIELLAKIAYALRQEEPEPEPEPVQYDFSRLSVRELETFQALLLKLNDEDADMVIDVTPSRRPEQLVDDKHTKFRRRKYAEPETFVEDEPEPVKDEFDVMRKKHLSRPKRKGNRPEFWPSGLKPGHRYMPDF